MDQVNEFREIVETKSILMQILQIVSAYNLPNWYIGAGAVAQTIWNYKHNLPLLNDIKDIDVVYYDPNDLTVESENKIQETIRQDLQNFSLDIDVTNEARVHLWYEEEFKIKIDQYKSTEDAIDTWPTTASAIGLKLNEEGQLVIYSPFGLDDLMNLKIRANKKLITRDVFEKKSTRWKANWPKLEIVDWES